MQDESRRKEAFLQYAAEITLGPFAGVVLDGQQNWIWDASQLDSAILQDLKAPTEKFAQAFGLSHG